MRVLIFSHTADIHADAVQLALTQRQADVVRLNADQVSQWSLQFHKNRICVVTGEQTFPVTADDRYFVRFLPDERSFQALTEGLDKEIGDFCARQHAIHFQDALSVITSILSGIDKPSTVPAAQSKTLQLMLAQSVGLVTPETFTGSDANAAWAFCASVSAKGERLCQNPVLGRMLDFNGRKYSSFTELADVKPEDLSTITQCPVTLQRYVPKSYELRVAVVDGLTLSARIDSQLAGGRTAVAAVAAGSLLVIAVDVVQAPNDKRQLAPMLGKIAALPDEFGQVETLLADNGYFSEANVNTCAAAGIEPIIAMGREAHHLSLAARFAEPPPPPQNPTPLAAMAYRLTTPDGRKLYGLRKQTPEPVFGIIKSVLGFRQFLLRGLDRVRGEWSLVTMAWNIKRMFVLAGAN